MYVCVCVCVCEEPAIMLLLSWRKELDWENILFSSQKSEKCSVAIELAKKFIWVLSHYLTDIVKKYPVFFKPILKVVITGGGSKVRKIWGNTVGWPQECR